MCHDQIEKDYPEVEVEWHLTRQDLAEKYPDGKKPISFTGKGCSRAYCIVSRQGGVFDKLGGLPSKMGPPMEAFRRALTAGLEPMKGQFVEAASQATRAGKAKTRALKAPAVASKPRPYLSTVSIEIVKNGENTAVNCPFLIRSKISKAPGALLNPPGLLLDFNTANADDTQKGKKCILVTGSISEKAMHNFALKLEKLAKHILQDDKALQDEEWNAEWESFLQNPTAAPSSITVTELPS